MNTELKIQHVSALMGCSYLSCPPENETERMWIWGGRGGGGILGGVGGRGNRTQDVLYEGRIHVQ